MSSPTPAAASGRLRFGGVLAAAAGLALFAYFVQRAGLSDIAVGIRRIGWAFLLILALAGLRLLARAAAWVRCMPAGHGLRLRDVFPAVLAGDALGNLTPLSVLIGEPAKAIYLRHRAPLARVLPALAVETLFYALTAVVVVTAGGAALLLRLRPPAAEWLATAVPLATVVLFAIGAHAVIWTRTPLVGHAAAWLARRAAAGGMAARAAARLGDAEARVHRDYPRDWRRLLGVTALECGFHLLAVAEMAVMLNLLSDRPVTLADALVFEAANRIITVVFKFVPLRIGVDEAGTAIFAAALQFGSAAGVTMALVRKGRMLVWMSVGMAAVIRRGLSGSEPAGGAGAGRSAVVVMARSPHGRRAPKTRLAAAIGDEADRRRLYAAFLRDTVASMRTVPDAELHVAYAEDGDRVDLRALGLTDEELLPQRGVDLGEREHGVFVDLFAAGYARVVMIGSDLPTLPPAHVRGALGLADARAVVLGRARDGGYYLIALAAGEEKTVPDLFRGIRWSTPAAFDDTVAAARRVGLTVSLVPPWYDVDDEDGLAALRRELAEAGAAARAPATAAVLSELAGGRAAPERTQG